MSNHLHAYRAPVPGLRTTRVLLLLPLVALLYFAGSTGPVRAQTSAVPSYDHIFFVIDENHSRTQVIGPAPYLTGLANANAQSATHFAVTHPSVNNYLALFSGQTYSGITDGCTVGSGACHTAATNIADEIVASGRTARGYMESMPSACYVPHDSGAYTERHNPFPYYDQIRTTARCAAESVPYTQLAGDLSSAATTPNFVWITPDLNNDMHDGSVAQGDAWAQANFPTIFNSAAWKTQHSLLVFTTDEDNFTSVNNIPFVAISSDGSTKSGGYVSTVHTTSYSWLRTIETAWSLGQMTANDSGASAMTDLFTGSPAPSPSPPPTTGVLNGTVTNASGGAAISGATVSDSGGTSTTTNGSGAYSLPGLNPGSHTLTASVTGFKTATQTASVTAGATSSVNFSLTPVPTTGALGGSVSNSSGGAAIAGATVTDTGGASASTDASGAYALSGLTPGTHVLTAAAAGFSGKTQTASVTAGQTTLNVNFSLTPSLTTGGITGTVTSSVGGAAIAGATVTDSGGAGATTDASGIYTISGLTPGSHTLTAAASGFSVKTQTASVTAGQTTLNVSFSLTPAASTGGITGTVTSTVGGAVIAGATVKDSDGTSATTDGSGVYSLPGLNPGIHTVTASVTGFTSGTLTAAITAGTTQNVNFSLTPVPTTGALTGSVTNASGGAAIAGATVSDSGGASATTDAAGAYTLSGLTPGSHTLIAAATGFTSQTLSASVTAGNTTQNASFSLVPIASGTPALVQTSGATESSASTSLTGTFPSATSPGHLLVLSASVYTGISNRIASVTDSGGNTWTRIGAFAVAGHYSDGEMWYAASAGATTSVTLHTAMPGVAVLAIQEFSGVAASSPLTASTGASNTGSAPSTGAMTPTAASDLVVGFIAGHSNAQAISVSSAGYTAQVQQTSRGVGSTIASVVTGYNALPATGAMAYTASLSSSMYWAAGIASFKATTSLPVPTTGSITGTVTGAADGAAIPGATVTDGTGTTASTDGSGFYSLTGLSLGNHVLTASAPGFIAEAKTAPVTAGSTQNLGFTLLTAPTTGALGGTVTNASTGAAIAGVTVTESGGAAAVTNALGAYTLAGLAPGSNTLTATAGGFTSGTLTASVTSGQTRLNVSFSLTPSPSAAGGPIRAAFLYDWYPETWSQGSHYAPSAGRYASAEPAVLQAQVASMLYAKITTGINSWFGPGTVTDSRINAQLTADHGTAFTTALYYEREGYVDPSSAQIGSDMDYAARYFADPSYLHINGQPVVFVYANGADNCGMAQRWAQGTAGKNIYVVLKVFPGYLACADQPSSWHQYSGAAREDRQGKFSTTISPGFWKWGEAAPRLTRDPVAFAAAVRDMVASGAQWQLIVSYNEYVEGTQIEATTDMPLCAGHGVFLTILNRDGNPGPC